MLGEPSVNLSMQGTVPQSNGTPVPIFDPAIVGQINWQHQTTPQPIFQSYDQNALVTNSLVANAGIQQGFATGGQVALNFNNNRQSLNALTSTYNPFTGSSLGLTLTQPLLRGFGRGLNRRFIRIAGNEQKITSLLFQQQLIATTYGVIRLYTDFVALYEDEKVKQETVAAAEKLLADTKAQVDEGTLAQVELTRANAQVFSTRQDLINSRGLREEQEAILKNVLTRSRGSGTARCAHRPHRRAEHSGEGRNPPDAGSAVGCVGAASRSGAGEAAGGQFGDRTGGFAQRAPARDRPCGRDAEQRAGGPGHGLHIRSEPRLGGRLRQACWGRCWRAIIPPTASALQVTLPIHNRIADADLARDELQVKQSQVRVKQLQNQARLEVEDALIAMRRSRSSYEAAVQARKFQQESLEAEQTKFEVGASTAFFVIQYESLLAQAKSTEVAALSSYVKAKAALQRATGAILDANGISVDAAVKGRMK